MNNFDAIFIAVGAQKSKRMNIPGEDGKYVFDALEFLKKVNFGKSVNIKGMVGVIGGGDAAVDAARVCKKIGAKEVLLIYRRTKEEMPANKEDVYEAEKEGIKIITLTAPTKILTKSGLVIGLECVKMELGEFDDTARRKPVKISGSEFKIDVHMVITAIGQEVDFSFLPDKLTTTEYGTIEVDEHLMTSIPGVFAGGDAVSGPDNVINAIAAGNKAGEGIDKYLNQGNVSQEVIKRENVYTPVEFDYEISERKRHTIPPCGFSEKIAKEEAKRCLRCHIR